jgi:hypothetical protein
MMSPSSCCHPDEQQLRIYIRKSDHKNKNVVKKKVIFSAIQGRVVHWKSSDVSEEHVGADCYLINSGFLLGLSFDPEDVGDTFNGLHGAILYPRR